MKSMIGILVVVLIAILAYQFYFSRAQSSGVATPAQMINVVGLKNDLVGIARAERAYQAEHGTYGSLDDLMAADALTMDNRQREGYRYEVEITTGGFRVIGRCLAAAGCKSYFVDQEMEVQPLQ